MSMVSERALMYETVELLRTGTKRHEALVETPVQES